MCHQRSRIRSAELEFAPVSVARHQMWLPCGSTSSFSVSNSGTAAWRAVWIRRSQASRVFCGSAFIWAMKSLPYGSSAAPPTRRIGSPDHLWDKVEIPDLGVFGQDSEFLIEPDLLEVSLRQTLWITVICAVRTGKDSCAIEFNDLGVDDRLVLATYSALDVKLVAPQVISVLETDIDDRDGGEEATHLCQPASVCPELPRGIPPGPQRRR